MCNRRETQLLFILILIIFLSTNNPLRLLSQRNSLEYISLNRKRHFHQHQQSPLEKISLVSPRQPFAPHPRVLPSKAQPLCHPVSFWIQEPELLLQWWTLLHIKNLPLFCDCHWPWLLQLVWASSGRSIIGSVTELYLPLYKLGVNFPLGQRLFQHFKSHPPRCLSPAFTFCSAKHPSVHALRLHRYPASRGKIIQQNEVMALSGHGSPFPTFPQ